MTYAMFLNMMTYASPSDIGSISNYTWGILEYTELSLSNEKYGNFYRAMMGD